MTTPLLDERPTARKGVHGWLFDALLRHHLIFNTSWEDPAIDRAALGLTEADRVLVITGAGCNVLDYVLAGAGEVHAVDLNPCQNALLELKMAAIRALPHEAVFELFGRGRTPRAREMYNDALRAELGLFARAYWDRRIDFFMGKAWHQSFYYRGTAGFAARVLAGLVHGLQKLREPVEALLRARSVEEQHAIYHGRLRDRLWTPWMRWVLSQPAMLSLIGIPKGQHEEMLARYPSGAADYIRDCFETVLTRLPFQDNYFWRVYFQGHYTPEACPEYLKAANFEHLRAELHRVRVRTATVADYLAAHEGDFTRFVLLDHMDWMKGRLRPALAREWAEILRRAAPGARVLYRSAGRLTPWVDDLEVDFRGRPRRLGDLFHRRAVEAEALHALDRVHTYGSFHILDLPA